MRRGVVGLVGVTVLALAACSTVADPDPPTASGSLSGELVVLAAASLQETFTEIGDHMMAADPALDVQFSFAGSSTLAQQLLAGAPADVIATASAATMQSAAAATEKPVEFTSNVVVIAVPKGNPAGVTGLADFADPDLRTAVCAPQVPCGAAAAAVFEAAGVVATPDTYERDVKATLMKVAMGEVDAGIVYRTDVAAAADDVDGVEVPEAEDAATTYLIATARHAPHSPAASAFVEMVLSAEGQAILADAGFGAR